MYCGRESIKQEILDPIIHNSLKIVCLKHVFLSWNTHSEVGIRNIPMPLGKCVQILVTVD